MEDWPWGRWQDPDKLSYSTIVAGRGSILLDATYQPITYLTCIYPSASIYKPSWKDEFTPLQWRLDGASPSTFGLVATQVLVIFEFSRQESLEEMGVLMTSKYVDQELRWKS